MSKPLVAIVGRPNVGKSQLFNKIVGERISIVEDTPGVTRDRVYAPAQWLKYEFNLVDTGGIEPHSGEEILKKMHQQAQIAIETADVIIFLVDVKDGLTAADRDVAAMLQKSGKPVVLACNKVDNVGQAPMELYEFYNLGLGDPMPISAIHGLGTGDLLDEVCSLFPRESDEHEEDNTTKVALIGKPNVGKSSLVNQILREERVIVSNVPGTTRDAIDSYFENEYGKYVLIDTAGMRKRGKIDELVERYSVIRSLAAVDRCDVCLLLIDATQGVTEQDTKIAGYAHDNGKAIVIAVNKWDAVDKTDRSMSDYQKDILEGLAFLQYAPQVYISAKTGQRVDKIFPLINRVKENHTRRISTGLLNEFLSDATYRVQPPSDKGKRLKIYYMTQVSDAPPTFVLFVNDKKLAHFSYIRYLENRLREGFDFMGTRLRFIVREKGKDAD